MRAPQESQSSGRGAMDYQANKPPLYEVFWHQMS